MKQAVLNYEECQVLAEFLNRHIGHVPEREISDVLRSVAAKIESVVSGPQTAEGQ